MHTRCIPFVSYERRAISTLSALPSLTFPTLRPSTNFRSYRQQGMEHYPESLTLRTAQRCVTHPHCTQWSRSGFKLFNSKLGIISRKGLDLPHLGDARAPAAAVDDVSDDLPLVLAAADLVPEHLLRQRPLDRLLQLQELGVVPQVGQRVARP